MIRTSARALAAVAFTTAALGLGAVPASAATEEVDSGRGEGFSASWVDPGTSDQARAAGLRGNTHLGFVQTFQNVGKPLFVDGTLQDFRCKPGQDVLDDECQLLQTHVVTAARDRAQVNVAPRLVKGRLLGTVKITNEDGVTRRVAVDLRLAEDGRLERHHYLDEVIDVDYVRRYEEIGKERPAEARGILAGSRVRNGEGLLLKFSWSDYLRVG